MASPLLKHYPDPQMERNIEMLMRLLLNSLVAFFVWGAVNAVAAPIYLNESNISVSVGSGTSPGSFNNTCQWPFILTHLWPIKLTHLS